MKNVCFDFVKGYFLKLYLFFPLNWEFDEPLKKAFCCLSTRMCTLVFLHLFLGNSLWSMFSILSQLGDPIYREFFKDNSYIFFSTLFIALIGGLIFLAAILSIGINKPSIYLLCAVVAFLILHAIYSVYSAFQYPSDEVFENLFDAAVARQIRDLPASVRDEYRMIMLDRYRPDRKIVYVSMAVEVFVVTYSVLVFLVYLMEVEGNLNQPSLQVNANNENASFPKICTCNLQLTTPRYCTQQTEYFTEPPPYSAQALPNFVESNVE